ncbi:LLM class flavin-dependent oxidoreductase [Streptomyces radiopugnans]|uniref:Luciferase-like monooxygenase n=1 Tax=Streptomyces radiopugnans TaxID=403935 RepID=A0A1H9JEA6_9ACTN|nr:LLM class flavin-dependent oxidoreductase [Streptomyces radiopugnans]SEQ85138.1 Luciferase-like monooxygenase [Streptomyces radiopugnans]
MALAAAAPVTERIERIGLGPYVSNAGVREPLLLVSDLATLDVVSGGRAGSTTIGCAGGKRRA